MGLTNLYSTDHNPDDSFKRQQYGNNIFEQGRRPHDQLETGFTAKGQVYDTFVMVQESEIEYTNLLDNQTITGTYPVGDRIYGRFLDSDLTITSGMVRAYVEYPAKSKS